MNDNRPPDMERRINEGWGFGQDHKTAWDHIIAVDNSPFKSDEEAYNFVAKRAAEGSEYHAVCLAYAAAERLKGGFEMTTIYLVHTDDDDGQNYSGYANREKAMEAAREWVREAYDEDYLPERESALEELEERMSADGWNHDCVRVEEINIVE